MNPLISEMTIWSNRISNETDHTIFGFPLVFARVFTRMGYRLGMAQTKQSSLAIFHSTRQYIENLDR